MEIPAYAKNNARKALELRLKLAKYKKFGLDKKQAEEEGVASGVERAKQLIRNKRITRLKDIEAVCRFKRFLGQKKTQKVEGAINLWGGRRFIKKACAHLNKNDRP